MNKFILILSCVVCAHVNMYSQSTDSCFELREFEFPKEINEEWEESYAQILQELLHCGYDVLDVEALKLNSFVGYLMSESFKKSGRSINNISAFKFDIILDELDTLKMRKDYNAFRNKVLTNLASFEEKYDTRKHIALDSLYSDIKHFYELDPKKNKRRLKNSLLYFRSDNNDDCKNFEDFILKEESIVKSIDKKYEFYILDVGVTINKLDSLQSINYQIFKRYCAEDNLPCMVILDDAGSMIKEVKCEFSFVNICNALHMDTER